MTVAHGTTEAKQAIENLLNHPPVTRVEITPKDSPPETPQPQPVKAQKIEWKQAPDPKGELWLGFIGGRKVADVYANNSGTEKPHYSLHLGEESEKYVECSSIESGKRSAQRVLNKVVQGLVGGS